MALTPRIGIVRVSVNGSWDIDDLLSLSEALSETYGLFYPLVCTDEVVAEKLHDLIRKQFWSGEVESRRFGRFIYRQIPQDDSLKLKSFQYNSPGAIEIVGILSALMLAARVARSWIKTGEELLVFWEKVDKFFEKRKSLRKPKRETVMDADLAAGSDEALKLVFEVGERLGFDALSCERLVDIVGNPISTLKYLVAISNEARKLASLDSGGLIELPANSTDVVAIPPPKSRARRQGVEVVRRRDRRVKSPSKTTDGAK